MKIMSLLLFGLLVSGLSGSVFLFKDNLPFKTVALGQYASEAFSIQSPQKSVNASESLPKAELFHTVRINDVRYFHCGVGIDESLESGGPLDVDAPEYNDLSVRKNSFINWSGPETPSIEAIAQAGFYYTGSGDTCRCFTCGEKVKGWREGNNPWVKHLLANPVKFINEQKKCDFFSEIPDPDNALVLEAENGYRARELCTRCQEKFRAITLLPCGHFQLCEGCADRHDNCPACGKEIKGTVRTRCDN